MILIILTVIRIAVFRRNIYIYKYILYYNSVGFHFCGYVSNQVQYNMESAQYLG